MKIAHQDSPELQRRFEVRTGFDDDVSAYLADAWRHGHMAAWARHLDAEDLGRVAFADERMREWVRLVGLVRQAIVDETPPAAPEARALVERWDAIIDAHASHDRRLVERLHAALVLDRDLQTMWAIDPDVLAFMDTVRSTPTVRSEVH